MSKEHFTGCHRMVDYYGNVSPLPKTDNKDFRDFVETWLAAAGRAVAREAEFTSAAAALLEHSFILRSAPMGLP